MRAPSKVMAPSVSDPLNRPPDESAPVVLPRRTTNTPADLRAYGYTIRCKGCEAMELGGQRRGYKEKSRLRIEKVMIESEKGQDRLQ